ncbi:MAG: C40 family peptidase [Candidatus Nanopelagicales bacterium]|nr:C40 family peptidase [Candidatus Nanopelagicales bacterium]
MTPFPDSAPSVRTSLRTGREKWLSASMAALATVVTATLVWLLATAVPSTASGQAEPVTSADRLAGSDVGLHPRVREIDAEAMTQRSIELVEALNVASVEAARTEVAGLREQILTIARKQLGEPYRAGGAGPDSFDCGGFTQFVFKRALGMDIARTSRGQYQEVQRVKTKEALPGDLVFFFEGGAHHVGIYLGDGQMIDAPRPGERISVNPISGSWWGRSFTGIGRILPA